MVTLKISGEGPENGGEAKLPQGASPSTDTSFIEQSGKKSPEKIKTINDEVITQVLDSIVADAQKEYKKGYDSLTRTIDRQKIYGEQFGGKTPRTLEKDIVEIHKEQERVGAEVGAGNEQAASDSTALVTEQAPNKNGNALDGKQRQALRLAINSGENIITGLKTDKKEESVTPSNGLASEADLARVLATKHEIVDFDVGDAAEENVPTEQTSVDIDLTDDAEITPSKDEPVDLLLEAEAATEIPAQHESEPSIKKNIIIAEHAEIPEEGTQQIEALVPGAEQNSTDINYDNLDLKKQEALSDLVGSSFFGKNAEQKIILKEETPDTIEPETESSSHRETEQTPLTTEQFVEKLFNAAYEREKELGKEAGDLEKKGVAGKAIDGWRMLGKKYNDLPLKAKIGIGIGLGGLAVLSGSAAAFSATALWRLVGSAGSFVAVEKALKISHEKSTGRERGDSVKTRHLAEALMFSFLIGSGMASEAANNIWSGRFAEAVGLGSSKETVAGVAKNITATPEKPGVIPPTADQIKIPTPEVEVATPMPDYEVAKGDNLTKIIRSQFPEINGLEAGRQDNAIENIIAQIKKNPALYGIESGDVNKLSVGDNIDLEEIRKILSGTKINGEGIIEHAQNLDADTVARIKGYVPESDRVATFIEDTSAENTSTADSAENANEITEKKEIDETGGEDYIPEDPADKENHVQSEPPLAYAGNENGARLAAETLTDSQVEKITAKTVQARIDNTFGEKSFLGAKIKEGSGNFSPVWKAIKGETALGLWEKMGTMPPDAKIKVGGWLSQLTKESGQSIMEGETIEQYTKRATAVIIRMGNKARL